MCYILKVLLLLLLLLSSSSSSLLLLLYFIVTTHSVLCPLLSNGNFCIHFGGSLEYWMNEYEWISVSSPVSLSHCWQSYNLLYTVHFDPVPSPVAQCLIASHSISFHPIYTVVTINSNCELSFVTDLSVVVPSYFLFLCYVHSSSCCFDNTSFVTTTTATTINLFTPTNLHVVAPHCAVPNPALCWSCWWWHNFWFPTQLFTQFQLKAECLDLHFTAISHLYS